tara:strand:+ start:10753 stop:11532 length:780 start_codon:yes stop_codon:yes gene_type:complete
MKIIQNSKLPTIPLISQNVDDTKNVAYKVAPPLEAINSFSYIVGAAGSGKSSLFLAMLVSRPTKKKPDQPRFYYKYFDHIYLISASLQSLPMNKLNLNENRVFSKYSDEILQNIIDSEKEDDENNNCLIVLDDVIKQIKKSSTMMKAILNRRHCMTNPEGEGSAGCSVWILSQRYNELPLTFRVNTSSVYLFRTENKKELDSIKEELMADLTKEQQNEVLKIAWSEKYSFLLILNNKPTSERYYQRFNRIVINECSCMV